MAVLVAGCAPDAAELAGAATGGDPTRGRQLLADYGCVTCHTIPGLAGARALVGPPLAQLRQRIYLGRSLPNTPDNVVRWIRDPRGIDPETAMPNLGVGEQQARDITAYLYAQS